LQRVSGAKQRRGKAIKNKANGKFWLQGGERLLREGKKSLGKFGGYERRREFGQGFGYGRGGKLVGGKSLSRDSHETIGSKRGGRAK